MNRKQYPVYSSGDNWYYSPGVTRDFGLNKFVYTSEDYMDEIFTVVLPLKVNLEESDLKYVGYIIVEDK